MGKKRAEQVERADGRTEDGKFASGHSGNPEGRRANSADSRPPVTDPRFDVADLLGHPSPLQRRATLTDGKVFRKDDWKNALTGQGIAGRDKRVSAWFSLVSLSFDQLKDLWLGDDLASRAVETIPKQAKRAGYDITISDSDESDDTSDLIAEVKDKLELLGVDDALTTVGNFERAYGGGAILLGANDKQTDLTKPLDLNKVVSLDYLDPLEARECIPRFAYGNPLAPKYGQPEIYQIISRSILPSRATTYAATTMEVHESRLIVFPGIRVSRYQATYGRAGWGEAVLSRVWRVLRDFNTAWASAGVLVADFAQTVVKMKDLWTTLAQDDGKTYEDRIALMELGRSTLNAITIDAEDSWERQQTPVTGLPDLLEKFQVRLAAACDMPLTLLFGTSPAGMNATGESDIRFFYDRVDEYRQDRLRPALKRLIQILFRTCGSKVEPKKWSLKFRPLWQESAKDIATAMLTQAQADTAWIASQVISPEEVAKAHWGAGEYNPHLSIDFSAREAGEAVAAGPVTPEDRAAMEGADYTPPPGSEASASAPDPNTPPLSRSNVDRADRKVKRRRDADWNEEDHPRDGVGRFGAGSASSPERVAASLSDKGFVAQNQGRLERARDVAQAPFPANDYGAGGRFGDAAHAAGQRAIQDEVARIHTEHDATAGDERVRAAADDVRAWGGNKSPEDLHDATMTAIAETKDKTAAETAARNAGLVPAVPDTQLKVYEGLKAEQDAKLDAVAKDLDESQQAAITAVGDYQSMLEDDESGIDTSDLMSDYGTAADLLAGRGEDGGATERYTAGEDRERPGAPEAPEMPELLNQDYDETGEVGPWEPLDRIEYERVAADYKKALADHKEHAVAAARKAQAQLETLHEKQVRALETAKAAEKVLEPARERARDELPGEDEASDRVLEQAHFRDAPRDENEGRFHDASTDRLFAGAVSAHVLAAENVRESLEGAAHRRTGEDAQRALKESAQQTARAVKALSRVTKIKPTLYKPGKRSAGDSEG